MRTPSVIVVLLLGLAACGNSGAPEGANLVALSGLPSGACGQSEHQFRCWGTQPPLTGSGVATLPMQPGGTYNSLELVRSSEEGNGCGLNQSGALSCWDTDGSSNTPVTLGLRFISVTAGYGFQCALDAGGTVYCWGNPDLAGVSPQDTMIRWCGSDLSPYQCVPSPAPIASLERFSAISSANYHTCGLAQSGQVFCWGMGAIGDGSEATQWAQTPTPVESPERFSAVASGGEGTCAINRAGVPFCWGRNNGGMLGPGEYDVLQPSPVAIPGGVSMKSISLGSTHSCTIDTTGAAWCWGTNALGTGATSNPEPARVLGALSFVSLAAGDEFTCGVARDGAWCWGDNSYGQLGTGNTVDSPIPVRVASQDAIDPDD